MSPLARYRWWQFDVVGLILAQLAAIVYSLSGDRSQDFLLAASVVFQLPNVGLIALLATTPSDAIRLPVRRSQWIIVGSTLLMQGLSLALVDRSSLSVILALVAIGVAAPGVMILARQRLSPWWVVPLVWNPLLITLAN